MGTLSHLATVTMALGVAVGSRGGCRLHTVEEETETYTQSPGACVLC